MAEICRLVCLRERLRKGKDFAEADQVRHQLAEHSVTLEDKARTWTCSADGSSGRIPSFNDLESGQDDMAIAMPVSGSRGSPASRLSSSDDRSLNESSTVVAEEDDDTTVHIKQLVSSRERARANKQFDEADRLREELNDLGVELLDKEKLWTQASTGRRGVIVGYQLDGPTTHEVQSLVFRREKARQDGDYELGDLIRRELQTHKVMIFDKDKTWKGPNGQTGVVPSWSEVSGGTPVAGAVPTMPAGIAASLPVSIMLTPNDPRIHAVLAIMPELAPILHGVAMPVRGHPSLSQPVPMLASVPARGVVSAATAPQSAEVKKALQYVKTAKKGYLKDSEIQRLVSLREKARSQKDFGGADQIREAMRSIGLDVNDKDKTWTASDGRLGSIPTWSSITEGLS